MLTEIILSHHGNAPMSPDHHPALIPAGHPLHPVFEQARRVVLGKERQIALALACLLARGHLLIEDLPGVGKTTLAQTLARLLGLDFSRIQFTSDLLPADILGISIPDRQGDGFRFVPGPIFAQLVLADEINRATPKTQSALLEAMAEGQVSSEGRSRPLPQPFFVIATQNPSFQIGTFPLPESQLDRFLLRLELGYPDRQAERQLLAGDHSPQQTIPALLDPPRLQALQDAAARTHVAPALLDYVQALLAASRHSPHFQHGLSPRAGLGLLAIARAWAWLAGRPAVLPDDIQAVFPGVAGHRLHSRQGGGPLRREDILQFMHEVPIP
ncbi:MAG: hypothetical protein RIR00_538 [Pseudomonadota bacterium]|jgi:MoxR-like ATPase